MILSRSLHAKRGFLSLEIALALIVSAVLAMYFFRSQASETNKATAYIQADQIMAIQSALQNYANRYRPALVQEAGAELPSGVANIYSPSISELRTLGFLPSGFAATSMLSPGPFVLRLVLLPNSDCVSTRTCTVDGYVLMQNPVLESDDDPTRGEYDGKKLGHMLDRLGGNGMARVVPGGPLVGAGAAFTYANSAATAHPSIRYNGQPYPGGVVGMRIAGVTTPVNAGAGGGGASTPTRCAAGAATVPAQNNPGVGNSCDFVYPAFDVGTSFVANYISGNGKVRGQATFTCVNNGGNATVSGPTQVSCIRD
ncbi:MAG TPA: hypothetical protein VFV39_07455 [Limnobacter sp.]|nr:hypothetical protein [Limnobacter sp.]